MPLALTPLAAGSVSLAATTVTGRVALGGPSATTSQGVRELRQYVVTNLGPDIAYVNFGTVAVTAVAATGFPILPGTQVTFTIADAYIAAICPTSTAALRVSPGDGDGPNLGSGSGGGGPGGSPPQVAAATISSVPSSASTGTLKAANSARKGLIIVNTDANALYAKYGATATTAGGGYTVIIPSNGYWEMPWPIYTGIIDGIWLADGAGLAEITEL